MPHTKSKGQTRPRGTKIEDRSTMRRVGGGPLRRRSREQLVELPLRGPKPVRASRRNQAERAYGGDTSRRFDVARGRRRAAEDAQSRYGKGRDVADTLDREAKRAGRTPRKVAASTGRPRNRAGRSRT